MKVLQDRLDAKGTKRDGVVRRTQVPSSLTTACHRLKVPLCAGKTRWSRAPRRAMARCHSCSLSQASIPADTVSLVARLLEPQASPRTRKPVDIRRTATLRGRGGQKALNVQLNTPPAVPGTTGVTASPAHEGNWPRTSVDVVVPGGVTRNPI